MLFKTSPILKVSRSVQGDPDFDLESLMIQAEDFRLQKLRKTIDHDILQLDLDQYRQIHELQRQQSKEDEITKVLSNKLIELEKKRFELLINGLQRVNSRLEMVYKHLTNQEGVASLGYSGNHTLLFQQGIDFHCRYLTFKSSNFDSLLNLDLTFHVTLRVCSHSYQSVNNVLRL